MVVSLYAALLTIIYISLSVYVIRGISLNDGSNEAMDLRNFSEYTPLFIIILGLTEYNSILEYAVIF
jgi:uncharacterized membrane protein YecN with MAPEG domain